MLDFSFFVLFYLEIFFLIPSYFSVGVENLAGPLVECSTIQYVHPFYYIVLNFNDTNRLPQCDCTKTKQKKKEKKRYYIGM